MNFNQLLEQSNSRVMVQQVIGEIMEQVRSIWRKEPVMDHVNCLLQFRVGFVVLPRLVSVATRDRERDIRSTIIAIIHNHTHWCGTQDKSNSMYKGCSLVCFVFTRSVLPSLAHSFVVRCMHNGRSVDEWIFKFPAIAHACRASIIAGSCSLPNW